MKVRPDEDYIRPLFRRDDMEVILECVNRTIVDMEALVRIKRKVVDDREEATQLAALSRYQQVREKLERYL